MLHILLEIRCKFLASTTTNESVRTKLKNEGVLGMKFITNGVVIACLLISLAAATAMGNTKRSAIVLTADTTVNGTVVKKGMYEAVYDEKAGELSIFKGAKLIAKTAARIEKRDQKSRGTEIQTILEGMDQKLVSITFGGSHENVVVGQGGMQAGAN